MNKTILIVGFACLSVIAVAQSSGTKGQSVSTAQTKDAHPREVATGQASGKTMSKPAGSQAVLNDPASSEQVTAPRDLATGHASGKRQYQPVVIMKVQDKATPVAIEQQSPKATRKTSVSPADANQDGAAVRESPSTSHPKGVQARVATGDVNGDGKADAAINNSHSNIKNSKDVATGQTSGKRQHGDITITKEAGAAPQK
jgi:type VI protein secretion system component Hcp